MSDRDGILTTHTGSLPRPEELTSMVYLRQEGEEVDEDAFEALVRSSVRDVLQRQAEAGIDIVSDGEFPKPGFVNYIGGRLEGFGGVSEGWALEDLLEVPALLQKLYGGPAGAHIMMPNCVGDIRYAGHEALARDIELMRESLDGLDVAGAFFPAASPGCIAICAPDQHYGDYEAYLGAVADAMREEYEAIVEAGFMLQLDCPDIPMAYHTRAWVDFLELAGGFRGFVEMQVEAIDAAIADLPPESVRMHVCWGNYAGPHHRDAPISEFIDIVVGARPGAISFEAANPQHEHEWEVFRDTSLPDDIVLIPGVIDTKTNVVEHPELIANRITRFASIVGPDRVIASTDCGFGTFVGFDMVEPEVAWMKLDRLAEGARLASERL